ncbi:hypothetical protein [Lapillicoccus sp.]|uniref:hypothetical protein n=1 Tax=Lapillicoccus sp. TaxID=1909287 RepID=UPI0025F16773|nr:hypothetical protein [Lapillicoccus sp.]
MTVTTDTDRTITDLTTTDRATPETTTDLRATAFPGQASAHSPNLATLDMLRSTGRNPLLLRASRRTRPSRQRDCSGTSTR